MNARNMPRGCRPAHRACTVVARWQTKRPRAVPRSRTLMRWAELLQEHRVRPGDEQCSRDLGHSSPPPPEGLHLCGANSRIGQGECQERTGILVYQEVVTQYRGVAFGAGAAGRSSFREHQTRRFDRSILSMALLNWTPTSQFLPTSCKGLSAPMHPLQPLHLSAEGALREIR